jgi:hypothetical protein
VAALRRDIPRLLEDAENGLSEAFRALLSRGYEQLLEREGHIDDYTRQVVAHSRQHAAIRRLQTLPGYGPIVASVFASVVGGWQRLQARARRLGLPGSGAAPTLERRQGGAAGDQ